MNKSERKQLSAIDLCVAGQLSIKSLCKELQVTENGLGNRIIKLYRKQYDEQNQD